jgi:selenophosphate synthase
VQLLYDPQTSGGLLAAVSAPAAGDVLGAFERQGLQAHVIGRVVDRATHAMRLR